MKCKKNTLEHMREKQQVYIVFVKDKLIPNSGDKKSHCVMSGSPNLSIVVQQQPLILKCLSKKTQKARNCKSPISH